MEVVCLGGHLIQFVLYLPNKKGTIWWDQMSWSEYLYSSSSPHNKLSLYKCTTISIIWPFFFSHFLWKSTWKKSGRIIKKSSKNHCVQNIVGLCIDYSWNRFFFFSKSLNTPCIKWRALYTPRKMTYVWKKQVWIKVYKGFFYRLRGVYHVCVCVCVRGRMFKVVGNHDNKTISFLSCWCNLATELHPTSFYHFKDCF